jgi:hypothetical protein
LECVVNPKKRGDPMFDSPFEFCLACKAYVVLDQTLWECAREHRCQDVSKCTLQKLFTGIEFAEPKIIGEPQAASARNGMPLPTSP